MNSFSSRSAEVFVWNQERGSTEMMHTAALRRLEIVCFQQLSSDRSHHRRVTTAENAQKMEDIIGEDRIQVGRER
jgi:hypothetical protein